MKTASVFYFHKLKSIITSGLYFALTIVMCAFTAGVYFVTTKFFSPSGTSSLSVYFNSVPYGSIILIPAFCIKKDSPYDIFVPLSNLKKLILNFSAHLCAFIIMMIFLLWMPIFVSFYGDVDTGAVFVSFLFLIIYGISSIALCFLISEIFEKNVTAFAVSSLLLAGLNCCNNLPVYFNLPKIISSVFTFVGFTGHFVSAVKGIFSSDDFIYFLSTGFLLIFICYLLIETKRGRIFKAFEKRRILYIFLLVFLFVADTFKFDLSFDFSEDKIYSVSDYTKKLLSQNNNSFTVYFYKSGRLDNIYPSISNVSDFLRQYEKVSSEVSLKIIDCDKNEKARELLSGYGIFPERIKTVNSTSTEFIDVYSAVVIEGQGNIEVIPFVLSPSSLEYQLDLKILNLCGYKPFVNILSGDGQKLDDELRLLKDWFTNQGISVYEADTDSLYKINGPLFVFGENNFSFDDSILIENYMNSGKGNVLFCTSPYSVNIKGDWSLNENKNTYITQMLAKYGIEFNPSIVFDYSCRQISLLGDSGNKNAEIINYPMWISVLPQKSCRTGLSCFWASPLSLSENAVPYIYSSEKSFEVPLNFNNPDVLIETNPFMINLQNVQTNALQNKVLAAFVPLYSAECTDNVCTKSGFYVIADSLFASFYTNGFIGGENGDFRNFMFLTSLFWKMNGMNELASLQEKTSVDRSLYKRSVILK